MFASSKTISFSTLNSPSHLTAISLYHNSSFFFRENILLCYNSFFLYHAVRSIKHPFQNNFLHLVVTFFRSSSNQFLPSYFYFSSGKKTLIHYNLFNFLQKISSYFFIIFSYTQLFTTLPELLLFCQRSFESYTINLFDFKSNFFPHVVTLFHL